MSTVDRRRRVVLQIEPHASIPPLPSGVRVLDRRDDVGIPARQPGDIAHFVDELLLTFEGFDEVPELVDAPRVTLEYVMARAASE